MTMRTIRIALALAGSAAVSLPLAGCGSSEEAQRTTKAPDGPRIILSPVETVAWQDVSAEITTVDQVQAKTHEFQARFEGLDMSTDEDRTKAREILETLKHEAFALHRRACEIIYGQTFDLGNGHSIEWNMIPYDVQLIGAMTLHDSQVAEMRTGEGKTLVATIAAYLNALVPASVHIVTVNDYLARRDAAEM